MAAVAVALGDFVQAEAARCLREPFVASSLFHDVGVGSHFIFGDDSSRCLGIVHVLTDGADALPAQLFGGSPTSLTGNELVSVFCRRWPRLGLRRGIGTNQNWRAQPVRPKRFDQLLLLRVVKTSAVLIWRWLGRG